MDAQALRLTLERPVLEAFPPTRKREQNSAEAAVAAWRDSYGNYAGLLSKVVNSQREFQVPWGNRRRVVVALDSGADAGGAWCDRWEEMSARLRRLGTR